MSIIVLSIEALCVLYKCPPKQKDILFARKGHCVVEEDYIKDFFMSEQRCDDGELCFR